MQGLHVVAHCVSHIGHLAAAHHATQLEPPPPPDHFPRARLYLQFICILKFLTDLLTLNRSEHPSRLRLQIIGTLKVVDTKEEPFLCHFPPEIAPWIDLPLATTSFPQRAFFGCHFGLSLI